MLRHLRKTSMARRRQVGPYVVVHQQGLYRVWEERHLRRVLIDLQIDCVFDVGANRGQYYDMLRERCGFEGLVISFEPNPDLAQALSLRAARSELPWRVEAIALSDVSGTATLSVMRDDQFSSLHSPTAAEVELFADKNSPDRQVVVSSQTLSQAYARLSNQYGFKRPFLKLDTQGHDVRVARSGASVMPNFLGLQSELSFMRIYEDSPSFDEALRVYRDLGFDLSAIVPNNAGHYPRLIEADCIMVRTDSISVGASPRL